ncbi:phage head spike fiber domain-containing protein [Runella limosa]|uniref:phage head spike fiber domain-containing protein n=1 Tax=Runella limosa TaxID=370978 RepID=UPI00041E2445|nr:LamG-like jellyroll fold domain-containing protein [Runella limosa]
MADLIKGDTVTIGVTFPETYDPARIINITAALQGREVASLEDESVVATDDPRVFLIKLISNVTRNFTGGIPLTIALTDTILRVKHTKPYGLYFFESPFAMQDAGTKDVIDLNVTLNISEAGLTSNTTLASIYRGYSAYEIAIYKYGYTGTEAQWNSAVNSARVAAETAANIAAIKAVEAAASASAADASEELANDYADAAALSAQQALNKAGEAAASASAAAASANTATTKAGEAAASQTQAAASAAAAQAISLGNSTGFPSVRPTLMLDFANSRSVSREITFARNSIATYFDARGIMRTAAPNVPRIDFDPLTGECLGLLGEESRTNLLLHSNNLGTRSLKPGLTITENITSPDASSSAIRIDIQEGEDKFIRVSPPTNLTLAEGDKYTFSVFAWAPTQIKISIYLFIKSPLINISIATFMLTSVPTRYSVTLTVNGYTTQNSIDCRIDTEAEGAAEINSGTFFLWGAQLEKGAFPTSYIPTASTTVTRAADVPSVVGGAFSRFYNANQGTFYVEARGGRESFGVVISSGSNAIIGRVGPTLIESNDGTSYFSITGTDIAENWKKVAMAFQSGVGRRLCVNASNVATTSNYSTAMLINAMYIGAKNGQHYWNGHIKRLYYYPYALSDSQLQALTSY